MTDRIRVYSRATNPNLNSDLQEWSECERTFAPGPYGFRDALQEAIDTREAIERACGNLSYPAVRIVCGDVTLEGDMLRTAIVDFNNIDFEIEDARRWKEGNHRSRLDHYRKLFNIYLKQ